MANPWAIAAVGASVVGGGMGAAGNMKSGRSARAIAEYNARIRERDAKLLEQMAEHKILMKDVQNVRTQQEYGRFMESGITAYNKSGVMSGQDTPLSVLLDNALQADMDMNFADYNTKVEALSLKEQAVASRLQANVTRMEGAAKAQAYRNQAFGSLLGGFSKGMQVMALA